VSENFSSQKLVRSILDLQFSTRRCRTEDGCLTSAFFELDSWARLCSTTNTECYFWMQRRKGPSTVIEATGKFERSIVSRHLTSAMAQEHQVLGTSNKSATVAVGSCDCSFQKIPQRPGRKIGIMENVVRVRRASDTNDACACSNPACRQCVRCKGEARLLFRLRKGDMERVSRDCYYWSNT